MIGTAFSVVVAHTVLAVPPAFLIIYAGVQSLDMRLEHAAASLGATPWRRFRFVTVPLLAPMALIAALFAFLTSFDEVNTAMFLASGPVRTLPKLMYDSILMESDPRVTAASAVLVGTTIVVLLVMHLIRSRAARVVR